MRLKAIFATLALMILAGPALAAVGVWSNVTVTQTEPDPGTGNVVIFWLSANSTGSPCATQKGAVVVDVSTAAGAFAAGILSQAQLTKNTVALINGTGQCNLVTGYENLGVLQY